MSTELLINFDKNTSNKSNTESLAVGKNVTKEKKEGNSLFDSLMNEAKSESKTETKNSVKTESTEEEKTERKNSVKSESKTEDKITDTVKNTNKNTKLSSAEDSKETSNNVSVKKMVEKLVDIVVNAAKEMFDENSGEPVDTKELKNAIEDIVDSKLSNIADKDKLKTIIDKKLDIVKDSIALITKETKNVTESKTSESNDKSAIKETKKSKEIILKEVLVIKDNVKEIKKDVSLIINKDESKVIDQKLNNADSENLEEFDENIANKIKKNLSVISDSTDDIKTIITDVDSSKKNTKTVESLKELNTKIEYKVETIKEAISEIKEKVFDVVIVKTTGDEIKKMESSTVNIISNVKGNENSEKPLLASMFLNAQKSIKDKTSLEQIHDAKNNITNKKTIESVKESAKKLDLNLEETDVNHEEEKGKKPVTSEKKEELKTNNLINSRALNRALIDQKIEANNVSVLRNNEIIQKEIVNNSDIDKKKNIETVEMTVPKDIVPNLQNKIIGAQQKMGSFMSEVAKNMYLNYKPPVTAFRVNLNPANLGTISIMMKANKVDNSLSVSMNLSNSNTMETFTENKLALQTAIQKQFNETSNVTINFNMQDQSTENEFSQFNQNSKENKQNQEQNADSESNSMEEQEIIETNDYM